MTLSRLSRLMPPNLSPEQGNLCARTPPSPTNSTRTESRGCSRGPGRIGCCDCSAAERDPERVPQCLVRLSRPRQGSKGNMAVRTDQNCAEFVVPAKDGPAPIGCTELPVRTNLVRIDSDVEL